MKEKSLRISSFLLGIVMLIRFGIPATLFGAEATIFGVPWLLEPGQATGMLDDDLEFFGMLSLALGVMFFWIAFRLGTGVRLFQLLLVAFLLGGLNRLVSILGRGAAPDTPDLIALVIEIVFPVVCLPLLASYARSRA